MRKVLTVLLGLILIPFGIFAADRKVVMEIWTSTGCGYCPGAALGAEDMAEAYPGEVLIIEYHVSNYGDPYDHTNASARKSFYGPVVRGYPTTIFDGVDSLIGGFPDQSLFDPWYKQRYNIRKLKTSPLTIDLTEVAPAYNSTSGTLKAVITNESAEALTGTAHFVVTESNIPHAWKNQTHLHFLERAMLPNASGEQITLGAGEDITLTRDYTIDDTWLNFTSDENIEFGCFVQSTEGEGALYEIFQGAVIKFGDTTEVSVVEDPSEVLFDVTVNARGLVKFSLQKTTEIEVSLYDAIGRNVEKVHSGLLSEGNHTLSVDINSLPQGPYFLTVNDGLYLLSRKIVVLE